MKYQNLLKHIQNSQHQSHDLDGEIILVLKNEHENTFFKVTYIEKATDHNAKTLLDHELIGEGDLILEIEPF